MGEFLNQNMLNKIMNKIMPHKIITFIYALIKTKKIIQNSIQNGAKTIKKSNKISMLLLNSLLFSFNFFISLLPISTKSAKFLKFSKNQEKNQK